MTTFSTDIRILDLDLFDAAFPVQPSDEESVRRRFMTLFIHPGDIRGGGGSSVCKAANGQGETFALKRLKSADADEMATSASTTPHKKELRHSINSGNSASATPDYVTRGHMAAFYEEYRIQLSVGALRGFPRIFGFGLADGAPVIIMEWVEGVTLRKALRDRAEREEGPLPLNSVAGFGLAVLDTLARANELDEGFVHRDLSPRNIILRDDGMTPDEQMRTGNFDLCLIDFGSAAPLRYRSGDPTFTMDAGVWRMGTPAYAPPEMLSSDIDFSDGYRQSETIDTYALCSILYERIPPCSELISSS